MRRLRILQLAVAFLVVGVGTLGLPLPSLLPSLTPATAPLVVAAPLADPLAAPMAAPDNSILLQPFLSGLSSPVLLTHPNDGSGRLFIVEQGGKIKVAVGGQVRSTPFLDLTPIIQIGSEQGLLGLAFHPQYKMNGRFFVYYTAKPPPGVGNNTVAEYRVSTGNPEVADPTPIRTLFSIEDSFSNHNGGMIAFGPDGYLYVGMGDEGSGGDPNENAQNLGVLYGKLLRLDVDNGGNAFPPDFTYAIPPGNPFVGQGGARPEIWAYGFRNPWRWSFDRVTGDLFIGDVGQGSWEEVDFIPAGQGGGNFGWDDREGAHCYEPSSGCLTAGRTDPILEYGHNSIGGCSITGGYRYRGSANPSLAGIYFYADYCTGRIWKGVQNGGSWSAVEALDTAHNITSFGEDQTGELYVVAGGGSVFRLAQAGQPTPTPLPTQTPLPTCSERPRVTMQSIPSGPGTLTVTLSANNNQTISNNAILSVGVTRIVNAFVTIGNQVDQQSPFTVTIPGGASSTQLTIRRQQSGQAFRADLSVTDRCGPWTTFVGAGPGLQ